MTQLKQHVPLPATMSAVQYAKYGGPEVLQTRTVPTPTVGPKEVLVRVHGVSVNPSDCLIRSGGLKIATGWHFPKGLGVDLAGEVVQTGSQVTDMAVGQRVWGYTGGFPGNLGTAAEYAAVGADLLATAPESIDLVTLSALPTGALTALQVLRDRVKLRRNERVLIIGGSGGVGSSAVQLAKAMGARVTAIAGAGNLEFCRRLGADLVFDYAAPLPENVQDFDALVDFHGANLRSYRRLLKPGGRAATIATRAVPFAMASVFLPGPRVQIHMLKPSKKDLDALRGHVERGELAPQVEQIYRLHQIADAHRDAEPGHARGNRLIKATAIPG